ncbi:SMAD/FHA domain,Forkhead-associated (FHA) domain [Cinara cedri]|uniref:SMAD/FHA domain,Forkhead-associated (FHA) domain n=1 Tax=Cinara cedri TaxID=506608 RepID=A0A5E4MZ29_9HEMI|nr:SMAD/FHA domain,Forkhead-associated (FHA) domain [Cinara cedri]
MSNIKWKKSWVLECVNPFRCRTVHGYWIHKLNYGLNSIGRALNNDIIVENETVSKYHCQLRIENDLPIIKDVGSKNGTIVQGVLLDGLEQYILKDNDIINLSDYEQEKVIQEMKFGRDEGIMEDRTCFSLLTYTNNISSPAR